MSESAAQLLVAPADRDDLPLLGFPRKDSHLLQQVADAGGPAHHQHREPRFVEAEPAAQRALLTGRGRPEAKVDGQAEQLDPIWRHAAAQCDLAR